MGASFGPILRAMQDAHNMDGIALNSIDQHVRQLCQHQFASPLRLADPAASSVQRSIIYAGSPCESVWPFSICSKPFSTSVRKQSS